MRRDHWKRRNDRLDPATDFVEIYRNVVMHEFPWDMNQALSFALFRTYAVPGIGNLLDRTGEFTGSVQKRYDDTALLLEPPTRLGFEHQDSKTAIRRINAMHRAYDIPNDQFRYVLSTFVVVPKRWLDDYGKRPMTANEVVWSAPTTFIWSRALPLLSRRWKIWNLSPAPAWARNQWLPDFTAPCQLP